MKRVFFSFGPVTIYWYSIMIILAIIVGMLIASHESKKMKMKEYIDSLIFYLIIFGVIGARLYYVIFEFDSYKSDLLSILKVWEGGLAIYGAVIAGAIVVIYHGIKYKYGGLKTSDILVPSLIIGQAIGRWGNFFNQEAYGNIVTLEYLKSLHLPDFIIKGMYIEGSYRTPTFLYESLWCLVGVIILIFIRKSRKQHEGKQISFYLLWYGIGRFFIEGLRSDSLYLGEYRISQIVSLILIVIGLLGNIIIYLKNHKITKQKTVITTDGRI